MEESLGVKSILTANRRIKYLYKSMRWSRMQSHSLVYPTLATFIHGREKLAPFSQQIMVAVCWLKWKNCFFPPLCLNRWLLEMHVCVLEVGGLPPTLTCALDLLMVSVQVYDSHLSLFLCSDGRAPEYHSIFTLKFVAVDEM